MQNLTSTAVANANSRIPPIPPPKPKTYQLQYSNGQIVAKFGQFPRTTVGGQLPPPPGDSDTDSGICADSDNQLSPRHLNAVAAAAGYLDDKTKILHRKLEIPIYREHLTPDRRLCTNLPNASALPASQRRLPQRPQTSSSGNQTSRSGKQYRVRFADQVSSSDVGCSSSSSAGWDSTDLILANSGTTGCAGYSGYYFNRPALPPQTTTATGSSSSGSNSINSDPERHSVDDHHHRQFIPSGRFSSSNSYNNHQQQVRGTHSADDAQLPSAYSMVMTRLKRSDDQRTVHSNPFQEPPPAIRRFHSRSASLPRGSHQQSAMAYQGRRGSADCDPPQGYSPYTEEGDEPINAYLMRSVDNLYVSDGGNGTLLNGSHLGNGRRLPELPMAESAPYDSTVRQPKFSRQRRARRTDATLRSQSVGRPPRTIDSSSSDTLNNYMSFYAPALYRPHLPSVRAQLIALDNRGLRTVLIEKLQPGPFGFYIATGMLNQKRGIFISRVSLPSLAPVLSVGDEIIYVEDELVKGQDLEYVQALIAGKATVKIVLLPTVGPAIC